MDFRATSGTPSYCVMGPFPRCARKRDMASAQRVGMWSLVALVAATVTCSSVVAQSGAPALNDESMTASDMWLSHGVGGAGAETSAKKKIFFWQDPPNIWNTIKTGIPKDQLIVSCMNVYGLGPGASFVVMDALKEEKCRVFPQYGYETMQLLGFSHDLKQVDWWDTVEYLTAKGLRPWWNRKKFIKDAVYASKNEGIQGFTIDWEEPSVYWDKGSVTINALQDLVDFLNQWADAMHHAGKKLTITTQWLYGLTAVRSVVASTRVDKVHTMDTYIGKWDTPCPDTYEIYLRQNIYDVSADRLGVGMLTHNSLSEYPEHLIAAEFDSITKNGGQEIDFWTGPPPAIYLPYVQKWLKAPLDSEKEDTIRKEDKGARVTSSQNPMYTGYSIRTSDDLCLALDDSQDPDAMSDIHDGGGVRVILVPCCDVVNSGGRDVCDEQLWQMDAFTGHIVPVIDQSYCLHGQRGDIASSAKSNVRGMNVESTSSPTPPLVTKCSTSPDQLWQLDSSQSGGGWTHISNSRNSHCLQNPSMGGTRTESEDNFNILSSLPKLAESDASCTPFTFQPHTIYS